MKKIIVLLTLLLCYSVYGQTLQIFDIDTTNFPKMKAKFYAFGTDSKQIGNFAISDFDLLENGVKRKIINVSCPVFTEPKALSSILTIDVSGSMSGKGLANAKSAATAWINGLPLGKSECAITAFSNDSYLIHDFTTDRNQLLQSIIPLTALNGTDYDVAYWNSFVSGLEIAKRGKYQKVLVFLSDGVPNTEPQTQKIIDMANQNNVVVYCVTLDMPSPQCLKDIASKTGGLCYENITTENEARNIYLKILNVAQNATPCTIEWESNITCLSGMTAVDLKHLPLNITANDSYQAPYSSVAKLEFNPASARFKNAIKDTCIKVTITARNAKFTVSNITASNSAYRINPTSFVLNPGESKVLDVCYTPADSGYTYSKFTIENDLCSVKYFASGGFTGKKATVRTLKLIHPNGTQVFVVGMDTVITWEGVLPEEKVKIEYSTNNGTSWISIADNATGLSYNWKVPKTPSNQCLARVTAAANTSSYCDNPDVEICGKIWMGCNLDVDTYRNGDPIPEVTDQTEWVNLTTGAWCYYNNDPANGEIYGKLYNWYAVNDPRGLAPDGWHVPTDDEWQELANCLGGGSVAGGKLKSTGTIEGGDGLWFSPNSGATNETGFSALPGGSRGSNGLYYNLSNYGYWWSSTENYGTDAWFRYLNYGNAGIVRYSNLKVYGFSVRCLRD